MLVFVAPNCDAMCACRILSYMLRADAVSYKIKPVAGYGDIATANEELVKVCGGRGKRRWYVEKTSSLRLGACVQVGPVLRATILLYSSRYFFFGPWLDSFSE